MNYATGCAFNLDELLINLDKSKLKMDYKLAEELVNANDKNILIKRIFMDCVKMVVDDIIDNNITFELPTGSNRRTLFRMHKYDGEQFAKLRRAGKFTDVDFLASNFSGYQLGIDMFYSDGRPFMHRPVYIDKTRKEKITKNTNSGKQYY